MSTFVEGMKMRFPWMTRPLWFVQWLRYGVGLLLVSGLFLACVDWQPLECRKDEDCDIPKYDHIDDPVCLSGKCGECPKGNEYCEEEEKTKTDGSSEPPPLPDIPPQETAFPEFPTTIKTGSKKLHEECDKDTSPCEKGLYCSIDACFWWCPDVPSGDSYCQTKLGAASTCQPSEKQGVFVCAFLSNKGGSCDSKGSFFCHPSFRCNVGTLICE